MMTVPQLAEVRPTRYLLNKLVLPLPIKGGGLLRTVDDAHAYVLALPSQAQPEWELAWTSISKEADIPARNPASSHLHCCWPISLI